LLLALTAAIAIGAVLLFYDFMTFDKIDRLELMLNPKEGSQPSGLFEDSVKTQITTEADKAIFINIAGSGLIASLCITLTMLSGNKSKKRLLVPGLILLILILSLSPLAKSDSNNDAYRPRIYMRVTSNYVEASATATVVDSGIHNNCFIAYLLGIGNPDSGEFIEMGYVQDCSGIYVYESSATLNSEYQLIKITPTTVGDTWSFYITNIASEMSVYLNGVTLIYSVSFSSISNLVYVIQGETYDPYNLMNGVLNNPLYGALKTGTCTADTIDPLSPDNQVILYKWNMDFSTLINDYPYQIGVQTACSQITAVAISGGLMREPGGCGAHNYNR
jgi:hypothetical protein